MPDQQSNPMPDSENKPRGIRGWLHTRRHTLLWLLVLTLLILIQWPMFKGMFYRLTGSAPMDNIPWRSSYPAALDEARQSGKPVLLDFFADWCPPCQVMKHDVWPDAVVRQKLLEGYIPVAVNVDLPANRSVTARYQIDGIPTILIVDAEGRVLKQGGFMSRSSLLEFMTRKSP